MTMKIFYLLSKFIILITNTLTNNMLRQAAVTGIVDSDRGSYQIDDNAGVNLKEGKGYYLVFADPTDQNKEYASSQEFEIKPEGSKYPDPSATVTPSSKPTNAQNDDNDNNAQDTSDGHVNTSSMIMILATTLMTFIIASI